ncbi:DUF1573 domain-containing protein [Mucilaginibacter arboris]|uniref:DUF1573 domain-containing protein n=1 Tax=Mucilaginibacter arboris TaxID=2682090 RepID=A0A7K1SZJ1_9SPHI|nr:DUF1573 domain-containing protein [Mucilaginibacter arboris]MVN22729.1 DUF1573 domain-containing protein [Mucilaginibacter arboris]
MKKYMMMLATVSMLMACNQQNNTGKTTEANAATGNGAVLKFDKEIYDFGKIKAGDKVSYSYSFVNAGKSPLIITDAVASCGCTIPSWPKKPINPGAKEAIKVIFNSEGKSGLIDKQITITANTVPAQTLVHLIGEVETKK